MKRWIRLAAWLYPVEWRMRYGAEFDVLLDDASLRWSDLGDVIRGAAVMQMTSWMTYWKMAMLSGLAGAILAGGIAFAIQDQWVCTAAMLLTGPSQSQTARTLQEANLEILGRDNLIRLIQNPKLDLYPKERMRLPVANIAEDDFRKHLHIVQYEMRTPAGGQAFHIVFQYPDKYKARAVIWELVAEFNRWNVNHPSPVPSVLSVLENPILPEKPTSPIRPAIMLIGLIAGMMTGLLSLTIWRRTRAYAVVTMSIPRDTKQFVDSQIAAGQFRDLGDYIRELIRADQQRHK
jgi:hypothetical protein